MHTSTKVKMNTKEKKRMKNALFLGVMTPEMPSNTVIGITMFDAVLQRTVSTSYSINLIRTAPLVMSQQIYQHHCD